MSCSLSFIVTLYIFARVTPILRLCMAGTAVILFVLCLFLLRKPTAGRRQSFFLCICLLLAIAVGSYEFILRDGAVRSKVGAKEEMTLTINEVKTSLPYLSEFYVEGSGFRALLTCEYPLAADIGDNVSGEFHILDFEENINGYPEKEYQFSKGNAVHLYSYDDDLTVTESEPSVSSAFFKAREKLSARFASLLSDDCAAYYSCLLLGEKDNLPAFVTRNFRDLGISHLIAISGMHLGILTGALMMTLRLLRIHRTLRNVVSIAAILLFAALTGFPASLTRAAVATVIVISCYFIRKRPDGATAVTFAVALICLADPHAVFDIGLTLSYTAALGIVTVTPLFIKKTSGWRIPAVLKKITDGLFVTVTALTFTMPFSLCYFGTFSFVSLFTTLLFSPLICAALYLAPVVLLLGNTAFIGPAVCLLAEKSTHFTFFASSFLSEKMQFTLSAEYPFAQVLLVLFCLGFVALLILAPKRPWLYLIPIFTFTICLYSGAGIYRAINADKVFISISETGRNDTICLTSAGESTIIDISGATSAPANTALFTAKTEQYAVYVENYVLVNRTYRTVSFVKKLISANRINNLYLPSDVMDEYEISTIRETAAERGTAVHLFSFGDRLELGKLSVTANAPSYIKRSVMPIHSIMIEAGDNSIFYTGAAYSESGLPLPEADYIIAGSYGPLYKEEFSFGEENVIVSGTAQNFYSGKAEVYEKVTNVILNND